jgi:hypothetical protein
MDETRIGGVKSLRPTPSTGGKGGKVSNVSSTSFNVSNSLDDLRISSNRTSPVLAKLLTRLRNIVN